LIGNVRPGSKRTPIKLPSSCSSSSKPDTRADTRKTRNTLQRYVQKWRHQEIQRLICDVGSGSMSIALSGNNSREAAGNKAA
jgi:hypothetical protein